MLAALPFNRLSIGIQSFDDKELQFLSRRHTAQEAIDAVKRCQQHGFKNISIDLIYGLPDQTIAVWQRNLEQALALDIQHISSYHLIYEERTRMHRLLQAGRITPVKEETSTRMFAMLIDRLPQRVSFTMRFPPSVRKVCFRGTTAPTGKMSPTSDLDHPPILMTESAHGTCAPSSATTKVPRTATLSGKWSC